MLATAFGAIVTFQDLSVNACCDFVLRTKALNEKNLPEKIYLGLRRRGLRVREPAGSKTVIRTRVGSASKSIS